ncbi:MAG: amidohydrolase [Clostridia bacterium]|nr:amidohydrolase [Clostridia bacterium]
MFKKLLETAQAMQTELQVHYEFLHQNAEVGFELPSTTEYVKQTLSGMGIVPEDCGKCGITAVIGNGESKCLLLRADMDALPIKEQTGLDYACKNGNMHACGHDMHTAMLLGAARLIKENEAQLKGSVKLMFQPAEEILSGANNMIENGVMKAPEVTGAIMIHALTGVPVKAGTFIVPGEGISAPAADYFTVNVHGKGCHGSTPHQGVDSVTAAARILLALQEISAREMSISDEGVLTVGSFNGGNSGNVIADSTILKGTLRAFDDSLREYMKKRIEEIAINTGKAHRCNVTVSFDSGCPTLKNDGKMSALALSSFREIFGDDYVVSADDMPGGFRGGSEDFSYVSQQVPSLMLGLGAGEPQNGYTHPQHHPKACFDTSVLWRGSGALAGFAIKYLANE